MYGLWYPGLAVGLLLMVTLCSFQGVDFIRTHSYSNLESIALWFFFALWYSLCLINVCRIRGGKNLLLWKQCGTAFRRFNLYSAFFLPGLLFLGLVIAIFMGAPTCQALIGIAICGSWLLWGTYIAVGIKKNEITLDDFVKEEAGKEEDKKKEKNSMLFRFVTPSFALKYAYYPGLLGGFAVYLVLAGFRGGFDIFHAATGPNIKGFCWTLLGILLYVWAIINLFRIRKGKRPLFRYTPRRAFHSINTRSAVDMPLALIGILWSMGLEKLWVIICIVFILLFMAWGLFIEVGCYRNHLVPDGFLKKAR